jgi:hypothetical protein
LNGSDLRWSSYMSDGVHKLKAFEMVKTYPFYIQNSALPSRNVGHSSKCALLSIGKIKRSTTLVNFGQSCSHFCVGQCNRQLGNIHRRNHHGDRSPNFWVHGTIYILVPPQNFAYLCAIEPIQNINYCS